MRLRFREMFVIALLVWGVMALVEVGSVYAVSLKVWSTGETIRSTDLNSNFAALNTYTSAITDGRIDGNAQISHTKFKTPSLVAKAWLQVGSVCSSDPCTKTESYGIGNVNWGATAGKYTVYLSYGPKDADFAVVVTPRLSSATDQVLCQVTGQDSTYVIIECFNDAGAVTNVAFNLIVYDLEDP